MVVAASSETKGLLFLIPQPLGVADAAEDGVLGEAFEGDGVGIFECLELVFVLIG